MSRTTTARGRFAHAAVRVLVPLLFVQIAGFVWPVLALVGFLYVVQYPFALLAPLALGVWCMTRMHWQVTPAGALGAMTGLVLFALAQVVPAGPTSLALQLGRAAEVCVHRGELRDALHAQRAAGVEQPVAFLDTGGIIPFGAAGVALDPSGVIAWPPDRRPPAWRDAASVYPFVDPAGLRAQRVFGDYYVWWITD